MAGEMKAVKANITWKGTGEEGDDTDVITWYSVRYEKGKALVSENPELIAKAQANQYFQVDVLEEAEDKPGVDPRDKPAAGSETVVPPSQQSAQGPVPKPGEPVAMVKPADPGKPGSAPGKPEDTPGKPGTGAPGQDKKPQVNPLLKK